MERERYRRKGRGLIRGILSSWTGSVKEPIKKGAAKGGNWKMKGTNSENCQVSLRELRHIKKNDHNNLLLFNEYDKLYDSTKQEE